MKLIKAFARPEKIADILHEVRSAGAPGVTVSPAHGVGYGDKRHDTGLAPNDLSCTQKAFKVEIVCRGSQVEKLLRTIIDPARTGFEGDGIAFVTTVDRALKIRNRQEGPEAL